MIPNSFGKRWPTLGERESQTRVIDEDYCGRRSESAGAIIMQTTMPSWRSRGGSVRVS